MELRKARTTTCDDGEQLDMSRYVKREGEDEQKPVNFTVFRQSERFYKQNKDLSKAIDFRNLNATTEPLVKRIHLDNDNETIAYTVAQVPGLYLFPGYLNSAEQRQFLTNVFIDELNLKNNNSLTAVYHLPTNETFYSMMKKQGNPFT